MYNRAIDITLLFLRVVFGGGMLLFHGWPKLMKFFTGDPSKFPDPLGMGSEVSLVLAVFAEALCAFLLIIGFFTRLSIIPLVFTMLVAMLIVHSGDPLAEQELALLYTCGYIAIFIAGPGWFSVDGRFRNKV